METTITKDRLRYFMAAVLLALAWGIKSTIDRDSNGTWQVHHDLPDTVDQYQVMMLFGIGAALYPDEVGDDPALLKYLPPPAQRLMPEVLLKLHIIMEIQLHVGYIRELQRKLIEDGQLVFEP